jgi:plastocyanin
MKFSTALIAALASVAPVFAKNITVVVGANAAGAPALTFNPQNIQADKGDFINFEFRGGNHTVTQSSFANPCTQQFNTVTQQNGFTSPFMPYNAASGQIGVFTLEVTQTATPIWFFCARAPHCKGGMYGAINAPTTPGKTFADFAAAVPASNEPGFGVTAPFTPGAATTGSGSTSPSSTNAAGLTPSASETSTPNGASSLSAKSGVALLFAGVAASMLL